MNGLRADDPFGGGKTITVAKMYCNVSFQKRLVGFDADDDIFHVIQRTPNLLITIFNVENFNVNRNFF